MTRVFLAAILLCLSTMARAHGPAEWIQHGDYRNAAGELYCGEHDCIELAEGDVQVVPHGFFIKSLNEFVPYEEAQPSPGGYRRCAWGGSRKCFFAPVGAV